jgi:hypothetical protein
MANLEYLRANIQPMLDFNNSLKYYSNRNNLYLKLLSETHKKSDWLPKAKKTLQLFAKNLENSNFSNDTNSLLTSAAKIKLDLLPFWRGEENGFERFSEIKNIVKKTMEQWVFVPEPKNIEDSAENGYSTNATGFISLQVGMPKGYEMGGTGK